MALCSYVLYISIILDKASRKGFCFFLFLIECTLVQFPGDCTRSKEDSGYVCRSTTEKQNYPVNASYTYKSNESKQWLSLFSQGQVTSQAVRLSRTFSQEQQTARLETSLPAAQLRQVWVPRHEPTWDFWATGRGTGWSGPEFKPRTRLRWSGPLRPISELTDLTNPTFTKLFFTQMTEAMLYFLLDCHCPSLSLSFVCTSGWLPGWTNCFLSNSIPWWSFLNPQILVFFRGFSLICPSSSSL